MRTGSGFSVLCALAIVACHTADPSGGPAPGDDDDDDDDDVVDAVDEVPEPDDTSSVDPEPVVRSDLAGRLLGGYPGFTFVRTFGEADPVHIAVDPIRFPQIAGRTCDVFVVAHRSAADWDADPQAVDARGQSQPHGFDGVDLPGNTVVVAAPGDLSGAGERGTGASYDVLLDCDRDGALSAGDVLDGYGDEAGFYVVPDLTRPGPHAVTTVTHTAGPWLDQITYYPNDLVSLGAVPLVVVAHGFGHQSSYYDHIGEHLASYGYVVTSIRNDVGDGAAAATESAATTLLENTDYILRDQATLADGVLDGHLDAAHIVWIGHSTGGECAVRAFTRLHDGEWQSPRFSTDSIDLVSALAPVAFLPRAASNPYDVNFHLMVGAADRDTANYPEDGYTQNLALFERATGNRSLTWIHGAGHGDLHNGPQNWLDRPEPRAPDLIGTEGAHPVVKGYQLALVEWYTRGNLAMLDFFERSNEDLRPAGIAANVVLSTEYRPSVRDFVIDDFQNEPETDTSSSGGAVTGDAEHLEEIEMTDYDWSYAWTGTQPSNGMTRNLDPDDDARAVVFDWAPGGVRFLEFEVVAAERDLSDDRFLLFRVAQGTRHPLTDALDAGLSFTVSLRDTAGTTSGIDFARYGHATRPYERPGSGPGAGWANEFVTVRIPLVDFLVGSELDLAAIEAVRFELGAGFGSEQGRVAVDDLLVVR